MQNTEISPWDSLGNNSSWFNPYWYLLMHAKSIISYHISIFTWRCTSQRKTIEAVTLLHAFLPLIKFQLPDHGHLHIAQLVLALLVFFDERTDLWLRCLTFGFFVCLFESAQESLLVSELVRFMMVFVRVQINDYFSVGFNLVRPPWNIRDVRLVEDFDVGTRRFIKMAVDGQLFVFVASLRIYILVARTSNIFFPTNFSHDALGMFFTGDLRRLHTLYHIIAVSEVPLVLKLFNSFLLHLDHLSQTVYFPRICFVILLVFGLLFGCHVYRLHQSLISFLRFLQILFIHSIHLFYCAINLPQVIESLPMIAVILCELLIEMPVVLQLLYNSFNPWFLFDWA